MIKAVTLFLRRLRSAWRSPSENAAQLLVSLAIVAVVLIVLVIGATAIFRLVSRMRRQRWSASRVAVWVGLPFAVILVLLAATSLVARNSSFCGKSCHSVNPAYQSWRRSSHKTVACMACHGPTSVGGTVTQKITGAGNVFKEMSGRYPRPINGDALYGKVNVEDDVCLSCHQFSVSSFQSSDKLKKQSAGYLRHRGLGMKCVDCHNRVAHQGAEAYSPVVELKGEFAYPDFQTMKEGCWRCHQLGGKYVLSGGKFKIGPFKTGDGRVAKTACVSCHPRGNRLSVVKTHGEVTEIHRSAAKQDEAICRFCHSDMLGEGKQFHQVHRQGRSSELKCGDCHKSIDIEPRSTKGKVTVDRQVCGRCHKSEFPAYSAAHKRRGWVLRHQSLRGSDTKPCMPCHKLKELDFCDKCHKSHPGGAKWVNGGHGAKALASVPRGQFKTGSIPCDRCHARETFCAGQCHKGFLVPHDRLRVWHRDEVRADREACRLCHKRSNGLDFCSKRCHHEGYKKTYGLDNEEPWSSGKQRHGVAVRALWAQGAKDCMRCHEQKTWCSTKCHGGVTMPHLPGWRQVHFTVAGYTPGTGWQPRPTICDKCHNPTNDSPRFCFDCHHRELTRQAGVKRFGNVSLMRYAREKWGYTFGGTGGQSGPCQRCHQLPSFCVRCHLRLFSSGD